jgi:hypothetical protein
MHEGKKKVTNGSGYATTRKKDRKKFLARDE